MPSDQSEAVQTKLMTPAEALDLAVQSINNGNPARADKICRSILKVAPDNPQVLLLRAMAETEQWRLKAAEKTVRRVLELEPDSAEARTQMERIGQRVKEARNHQYTQEYLENRAVHMDYPRFIGIETVGRCNATCGFCPHSDLDRKYTEMTDDLFEKIVRDLQEIPPHVPMRITPNVVNEPFMDKKLFTRLRRINEALPNTQITIFTNFNVLPKNFPDRIREVRNLAQINVSFNAANEEEYRQIMGIDFERTVDHLKRLMTANRDTPFLVHPVVLSRVKDHTRRDKAYKEECREVFRDFEEGADYVVHVKNRINWLGATADKQSPISHALPCGAWLDINILCNGVVPLCCVDSKAEYGIGDVTKNSVLEIYNAKEFKSLRTTETSREATHPCGSCALLQ